MKLFVVFSPQSNQNLLYMKKIFTTLLFAAFAFAFNPVSAQVIDNGGFETWDDQDLQPEGWYSFSNYFLGLLTEDTSVTKVQGYKGFAAQVRAIEFSGFYFGILGNGEGAGVGYTGRPTKLSFRYKYTGPAETTVATVTAQSTKWNTSGDTADVVASAVATFTPAEQTDSWKTMTINFVYDSTAIGSFTPDSLSVSILLLGTTDEILSDGSKFIIDEVVLDGNTSIFDLPKVTEQVTVYPSVASTEVNFGFANAADRNIVILNMEGKEVLKSTSSAATEKLNVSSFADGTYLYSVYNTKGEAVSKGKFVVAK